MSPPAQAHQEERARLAAATARAAGKLWRKVDRDDLRASWTRLLPEVLLIVSGAQTAAARGTDPYLKRILGDDPGRAASDELRPESLAGVAPDGRSLASLLMFPLWATLSALKRGASLAVAWASGAAVLDLMVRTVIADTGRAADLIGMIVRPAVTSYVRVVELPACARCIVLAGREYSLSTGFERHPRCFPAGVVVSGPSTRAATRRRYEGELVVVTTASGKELPVTGNHPVLTDRGWIPANVIKEGDYVVRSLLAEGAVPLTVPDERQAPSRIEDLWRPGGVMPLLQMPTAAEDFHGDGGYGDVDVVLADRLLRNGLVPALSEPFGELAFALGVESSTFLATLSAALQKLRTLLGSSHGGLGGSGLGGTLLGGHLAGTDLSGLAMAPPLDTSFLQAQFDGGAGGAVSLGKAVHALSSEVGGHDLGGRQHLAAPPRWDPPGLYGSDEDRLGYAGRGADLGRRLAGQVELDRVVELRRVHFSGHVYNLSSSEGWYSANGLIVSNCDCTMDPVTRHHRPEPVGPGDVFARMTDAQRLRAFGAAAVKAIGDGADIGQLVNARRGMTTATYYRRTVQTTSEGITRRGIAGQRSKKFRRTAGNRYATAKSPRLMPEEIYRLAKGDREHAVRLLRRHAYIV